MTLSSGHKRLAEGVDYRLIVDTNKALFILLIEIILILLLIYSPPIIYVRVILSFLSIYIIPTILLTLLFVRGSINFVKLLFLSLVVSPLLAGSIAFLLSVISPPLNRFLFILVIAVLVLIFALSYISKKEKVLVVYSKDDLVSLLIIFIAFLFISYTVASLPHYPTPDEDYYITNARLLLDRGQAFPISVEFWVNDLAALFTSRILWVSILASFIASTGIPPLYSNCISLFFLLGISLSSLFLIPERYRRSLLVITIPMLVISNPVLLMLSGYALNDLAIAFYNVASLTFFINSFKKTSEKIELDSKNLIATLLLQFSAFLIKLNVVFFIPYFLVLTISIFRLKLYRFGPGRIVTIFVILPVLLYELIIDIPRNLALYLFKTRLEFLERVLVVTPAEQLILMFTSVPYHQKTVFDYTIFDYLWRLYIVFSPENLSVLVGSIAILLPFLIFLIKKPLDDIRFKNMILVTLLAIMIQFLFSVSSDNWGDIPRYYAGVIVPLIVASTTLYLEMVNSRLLSLVGTLFLLWLNHVLTERYGGVAVSWSAGFSRTFNILIFQTLPLVILAFIISSLPRSTITFNIKVKIIRKDFRVGLNALIILTLVFSVILGNIYFSHYSYTNSPYFKDYGLNKVIEENNQRIIFSNSYVLGTYASEDLFHNGFILSLPSVGEFDTLINNMPNETKLIIFVNPSITFLSRIYIGDYLEMVSGEKYIVSRNSTQLPIGDVCNECVIHIYFLSGSYNVTIGNRTVEPIFNNILWINYSNIIVPYFTGSGSFIEIPYTPLLNLTPPYSIEAWILYEEIPGKDAVIIDMSTEFGGYLLFIRERSVWFSNGFGNNAHTTKLKVEPGVWTHLMISYNGTHTTFYVNGKKEVVEGPKFRPINKEIPMWIGRYHWAFDGKVFFFGIIGAINIYDRLISDQEVEYNYYRSLKMPYFKLYEKISLPTGDIFVYELYSPKLLKIKPDRQIVLNGLSWEVLYTESSVPEIVLRLSITSIAHRNLTVILSNHAFSVIQQREIYPGANEIELRFKSFVYRDDLWLPYGAVIARMSNILIIDDRGNLVLSDVISIFQFTFLQLVGYGLLCIVISLLLPSLMVLNRR